MKFTQLSPFVNVRRKLIPQMRSLVSETKSIIIGLLREIVFTVPYIVTQWTRFEYIRNTVRPVSFYTFKKEKRRKAGQPLTLRSWI